eukprot:TRINITY_DN63683_c0_g1_i2.p1 TRINITY_DN63683_c0_g1~~TRINITY_DN63683_c0_g1_i2.p1  ORF type:complete len:734 (-),score=79.45 TRINITY_DN63683_c0_g1_i2:586-2766(-)
METEGAEVVEQLVRLVGRAFYDDEVIMVLDALLHLQLRHGQPILASVRGGIKPKEVKNEDGTIKEEFRPNIRSFLRLNEKKAVDRALVRLVQDCLVQFREYHAEVTAEERKKQANLAGRELRRNADWLSKRTEREYFIDFKIFYEVTAFKVHQMRQLLRRKASEASAKHQYVCPIRGCEERYSLQDILGFDKDDDTFEFICRQCERGRLKEQSGSREQQEAKKMLLSFDNQLHKILDLLQKGKEMVIVSADTDQLLNSADFMTQAEYKTTQDKAVIISKSVGKDYSAQLKLDAAVQAHHDAISALSRDKVTAEVIIDEDRDLRSQREKKEEEERERSLTETMPPWLAVRHDDSHISALSGMKKRSDAARPSSAPRKKKKTLATLPSSASQEVRYERSVYEFYCAEYNLDLDLVQARERSQRAEFVSPEEYFKERYQTGEAKPNTCSTPPTASTTTTTATTTPTTAQPQHPTHPLPPTGMAHPHLQQAGLVQQYPAGPTSASSPSLSTAFPSPTPSASSPSTYMSQPHASPHAHMHPQVNANLGAATSPIMQGSPLMHNPEVQSRPHSPLIANTVPSPVMSGMRPASPQMPLMHSVPSPQQHQHQVTQATGGVPMHLQPRMGTPNQQPHMHNPNLQQHLHHYNAVQHVHAQQQHQIGIAQHNPQTSSPPPQGFLPQAAVNAASPYNNHMHAAARTSPPVSPQPPSPQIQNPQLQQQQFQHQHYHGGS